MTKDDIIRMARKAGIAQYGLGWTCWEGQLERFAALVAAAEREACAQVIDGMADYLEKEMEPDGLVAWVRQHAAEIRDRGEKK